MSLIPCPECGINISTAAETCPHCGYPIKPRTKRKKAHMRLPNGFGQISELKNRNLRNPYRAMVTVGKTDLGKPICKILGYYASYNDAYGALAEYNKNPYDLDKAMTVEELYTKWSEQYFANITPSSTRSITSAWSYCGSVYTMRAKDIRVRHIKGCMDTCTSQNIKNRIKSMFNLMLDYAVEYEICDKNYARDFKSEKAEVANGHHSISDADMQILWANITSPYVCYILIQCYMGWRPQELCKIELSNVDLDNGVIVGGMKTEAGTDRTVPICEKIMPVVKKIYSMSKMLGSSYLCPSLDGSPMTYDIYNKRFHRTMGMLNIEGVYKPHDPRKQFVTMAKSMEVDEYAIKLSVGHAISDITEKVYTDRNIDWLKSEINKVSEYSFE